MLDFRGIVQALEEHVLERRTGTMFITTADQHSARVVLREGVIVSMAFRATRGEDVLPLLTAIRGGTVTFQDGFVMPPSPSERVPATAEVIARLTR